MTTQPLDLDGLMKLAHHTRDTTEVVTMVFILPWVVFPHASLSLWFLSRVFFDTPWWAWFAVYSASTVALWHLCNWDPRTPA